MSLSSIISQGTRFSTLRIARWEVGQKLFEVTFETAWSPPEEIHSAISEQFDDLSMSWFYDEPGQEVAGYL